MAKTITVPKGTTTFKGYDKPRYSKSKFAKSMPGSRMNEICCNCHQRFGEHIHPGKCPSYEILMK